MLKFHGTGETSVEKIRLINLQEMFSGLVEELPENDEAIKARLRRLGRLKESYRAEVALIEVEEASLYQALTRPAAKPTIVKSAVTSIVSVECHICHKLTRNKVNGRFECKDHSAVSRMSELERRVLNDFMNEIKK